VQGTDHFYTIQGWLKGVNSVRLTAAADAGQDAKTTGLNKPFTLDAMGYVLRYHGNDYSPVGGSGANTMLPPMSTGTYATAFAPRQLYNGNIPSMLTALQDLTGTNLNLHANVYRYDLLNRIKAQTVYKGANSGTDLSTLASNNEYNTSYGFDPNGNFDRHQRRGNLGGTQIMDDLRYWYLTETNALYTPSQPNLPSDRTNKLAYVHEAAPVTTMGEDLEDQENISPYPYPNDNNYAYDEQGRLTQDILAGIGPDGISWNLQDKVRSVTRDPLLPNNGSTPDLEFRYGATGHRTVKVMKPRSAGVQQPASNWERTYYIHDAQGNPMAIYRRTYGPNVGTYNYMDIIQQEDALLYGSKRLGNWHGGRLKQRELNSTTTAMTGVTYSAVPSDFWTNGQGGYPTTALSVTRELGLRHYELSNHLGNVLSTVSDRRLAMGSGSLVAYYRAEEKSYADYDPYGMLLPGRLGGGFADQNFGFQGQLKDDELNLHPGTSYAFEYRVHDPRVGRFMSIDPLAQKYPFYSTYAFSGNRVLDMVELEGLEPGFIPLSKSDYTQEARKIDSEDKNNYLWDYDEEYMIWRQGGKILDRELVVCYFCPPNSGSYALGVLKQHSSGLGFSIFGVEWGGKEILFDKNAPTATWGWGISTNPAFSSNIEVGQSSEIKLTKSFGLSVNLYKASNGKIELYSRNVESKSLAQEFNSATNVHLEAYSLIGGSFDGYSRWNQRRLASSTSTVGGFGFSAGITSNQDEWYDTHVPKNYGDSLIRSYVNHQFGGDYTKFYNEAELDSLKKYIKPR
jgi:RHS repeat-associated protein